MKAHSALFFGLHDDIRLVFLPFHRIVHSNSWRYSRFKLRSPILYSQLRRSLSRIQF
jgi:hypothetical protein